MCLDCWSIKVGNQYSVLGIFVSYCQSHSLCVLGHNSGFPLDLLRCESLLGLDPATCSRVLNKNYTLLVSMAPLTNEIRPISSCTPQVKTHVAEGRCCHFIRTCGDVKKRFDSLTGLILSLQIPDSNC